jgi:hypothetical protein
MDMRRLIKALACLLPVVASCWAQSDGAQQQAQQLTRTQAQTASNKKEPQQTMLRLMPVETVLAKDEFALGFADLACDEDGSLYLGVEGGGGSESVRKINPKGELVTRFNPMVADTEVEVLGTGSYAVTPDGELYIWVGNAKDGFYYALSFAADGHFKSKTKLDPGVPWVPASLAVFRNGNFLITGQIGDNDPRQPMIPFTAIFRSDGKLLKEISLEDDGKIYDLARARDPKLTSIAVPTSNRAIAWGRTEAARDGNIYVMRWLSPATFYVISPGGEVLRRFTVDAGSKSLMPTMMHVSGSRIAILFRDEGTKEQLVKIVDLEGHEIATYDASPPHGQKLAIGAAFACYYSKQTRFTFLASDEDRRIMLRTFEPR